MSYTNPPGLSHENRGDLEITLDYLDRALSCDWSYKMDADSACRWLDNAREQLAKRKAARTYDRAQYLAQVLEMVERDLKLALERKSLGLASMVLDDIHEAMAEDDEHDDAEQAELVREDDIARRGTQLPGRRVV